MEAEQSDYSLAFALDLARLWKAGKLVGGDPHEVCLALVTHVDELERHLRGTIAELEMWRGMIERNITGISHSVGPHEKAARAYLDGTKGKQ